MPSVQLIKPVVAKSHVPVREEVFQGMQCLDTSNNPRIPVLMELVGAMSRANDPREVLSVFAEGVTKLYGPRGYISLSTRNLRPGQYRITRLLVENAAQKIHLADPWSVVASLPIHTGGFLGEIIRSAYPEVIHHLNIQDDPVIGNALADYRAMMAIPLFDNGEPLNWSIQLSKDPEAFTEVELENAILRANLVGGTVKNTLVSKQLREANDRIRSEMENIARIQKALLPQDLPKIPGLTIATSYEAFDTAGGDLYDFRVFNDRLVGVTDKPQDILVMLIADAAGHGPAAAVVSAMLNAILYAYPASADGPAAVLDHANRHLCAKRLEGIFVTAFMAAYHPPTRTLVYARAGHNPPLIKNAGQGGAVRRLEDIGGIPLGIVSDTNYVNGSIVLEPGQTLVLYTDGITEAMNSNREMFGVKGIEDALEQCTGEPACVVNSINAALKEHQGSVRPGDDQTIVAIKVD